MTDEIKAGVTETKDQDHWLLGWLEQILMVAVRGAMSCAPMIRPEKVMIMSCFALARVVSQLYAGDEIAVHRFRKACRDGFADITKQMPVIPFSPPPSDKTDAAAIG